MIRLGDITIDRIEDMMIAEPAATFAGFDEAALARHRNWLVPAHYDEHGGTFSTSIHSWLIRTPELTIVVDTGAGNGKERPASPRFHHRDGPYLERLAAAGVAPEDVDIVFLTHLHVDHIGWNTRRDGDAWVPTFPRARYVMSRIERDLRDPARGAAGRPPASHLPFLDSVQPILDAGLAEVVEGERELAPGLDILPIPGHAPGQMALRLRSGGEEAMFIADVMHQPIQVAMPQINSKYCEDQEVARQTRARILAHAAESDALLLPSHFGGPHGGWVEADPAGGYRFYPVIDQP